MRLALCWAGSRGHKNDANRSIPFAALAPLKHVPNVTWQSLLIGDREEEARYCGWLTLAGDRFPTFADTAAYLVHEVDLLISVDTAIVHLAGALGVRTWALIPAVPDFRWQLQGETSPWYPSVRLIRQRRHGAWGEVIDRVVEELMQETTRRAA